MLVMNSKMITTLALVSLGVYASNTEVKSKYPARSTFLNEEGKHCTAFPRIRQDGMKEQTYLIQIRNADGKVVEQVDYTEKQLTQLALKQGELWKRKRQQKQNNITRGPPSPPPRSTRGPPGPPPRSPFWPGQEVVVIGNNGEKIRGQIESNNGNGTYNVTTYWAKLQSFSGPIMKKVERRQITLASGLPAHATMHTMHYAQQPRGENAQRSSTQSAQMPKSVPRGENSQIPKSVQRQYIQVKHPSTYELCDVVGYSMPDEIFTLKNQQGAHYAVNVNDLETNLKKTNCFPKLGDLRRLKRRVEKTNTQKWGEIHKFTVGQYGHGRWEPVKYYDLSGKLTAGPSRRRRLKTPFGIEALEALLEECRAHGYQG